MANTVAVRFRSFLPGAGFDVSGVAKQGKQEVRGRITVSSYVRGGESLTAADLGLTTIDHLTLEVVDGIKGPSGTPTRFAVYNETNELFYIVEASSQAASGFNEAATAAAVTVSFAATGDSAHDVELK
jgi:hypothetical protein